MENHQASDNSARTRDEAKTVVVILCFPFQGHQNQLLHLSRIISSYDLPVHFVGIPTHNRQAKLRAQGWDPLSISNLHFHDFPIPSFDAPPPDPNDPIKFPSHVIPITKLIVTNLYSPIEDLLHKLANTSKRVVVIIDFIMLLLLRDFSSIPNVESYCFHVFSAFSVYYLACAFAGKSVLIHGEPTKDLPPVDQQVFGPQHSFECIRGELKSKNNRHGNLYNSCRAIEGQFLDQLAKEKLHDTDKHWALGPFTPISIPETERKTSNKYLDWLDKQLPKSVIFVAFGTLITFSDEQVKELALGLERSGHKFIWALRYADRADYSEDETKRPQLPEGFEERVEQRGKIIWDWAPQLEILGHPSTGGFLSHCGWNSVLESISMGVPIAAWPVHSEQPYNAILVERVLRIGLLVRECKLQNDEIVKSEAIEAAVKRLMGSAEGDEMRQRAVELSAAVKQSVKEDGDSAAEIANFVAHITR